jgi:alpha-L-arabinofuranosidase
MNQETTVTSARGSFGLSRLGACATVLAWLASGTGAATAQTPSATIQVNLAQQKAPVPPTLYGIFMEEISHAFDGGIYAELIQNRSFEEGVLPPGMKLVKKDDGSLKMELEKLPAGVPKEKWDMPWPWMNNCAWQPARELLGWSLDNSGGASGEMKITEANPMNAASSRSLALKVGAPTEAGGRVALCNSGYWGIDVRNGTNYDLKWYLRPGTFEGTVTATLESKDGKLLGQHEFGKIAAGERWQRLTAKITASGTDPQARFVLSFRGKGTLQVDWVSLFPPTYKDRSNGLRVDLAKHLEGLKPSFIRYPGGCYVEGLSWESAPDWRKMVCPPEDRPGQWGYWQYRSTDGFGYHEFLQFCEDLGSDAMYVAFCGMTVHPENNMPLDQVGPVIQQTLDAIEYALGPVESKWGAVRAKMGHPKPFPLKYIEIGNEHPPALYGDYYKKFRSAIKAKYPDMTVIMSMFWSGLNPGAIERAGDDAIDVVDEHSYKPSGWIRNNFDYFDKYPRKPWKIYVGEYAHHHGGGDWSAAMDDSVYLMMLERNGDLVKMASYAPLFVNVNQSNWGVNLIEFDSSRSFVHSSYHVQKTFAESRPDVNLATKVEVLPKPDPNLPLLAGKLGLGSWSTLNEFKELRIYDDNNQLVLSDDFANLEHWAAPGTGQWKAEDGVLKQTDPNGSPNSLFLKDELKSGRVTVKARRVGGKEGFLMFFHAAGPERYMFCNYGAAQNHFSAIQGTPSNVIATKGGGDLQGPIENERWYDISLVLTKNSAEALLDGKRVSKIEADALPAFFATAGYQQKDKTVVVKATNYNPTPLIAEIRLDGTTNVASSGQHIVIRSDKAEDENSLALPDRIAPQVLPLSNCAKSFQVTLPPHSVNVLRIPAN